MSHSRYGASFFLPLGLKRAPPPLLDSIDNILGRPLLSFYNPLLDDVPDVDFALLGPHYFALEVNDAPVNHKHLPRRIDDDLVMRMKRPIDLPDEDYQPHHSTVDYSGLVDASSAISLTPRSHLSSPRDKHRERSTAPDACHGSARCGAAYFVEPLDTPRRPRSFGHARH